MSTENIETENIETTSHIEEIATLELEDSTPIISTLDKESATTIPESLVITIGLDITLMYHNKEIMRIQQPNSFRFIYDHSDHSDQVQPNEFRFAHSHYDQYHKKLTTFLSNLVIDIGDENWQEVLTNAICEFSPTDAQGFWLTSCLLGLLLGSLTKCVSKQNK